MFNDNQVNVKNKFDLEGMRMLDKNCTKTKLNCSLLGGNYFEKK